MLQATSKAASSLVMARFVQLRKALTFEKSGSSRIEFCHG